MHARGVSAFTNTLLETASSSMNRSTATDHIGCGTLIVWLLLAFVGLNLQRVLKRS